MLDRASQLRRSHLLVGCSPNSVDSAVSPTGWKRSKGNPNQLPFEANSNCKAVTVSISALIQRTCPSQANSFGPSPRPPILTLRRTLGADPNSKTGLMQRTIGFNVMVTLGSSTVSRMALRSETNESSCSKRAPLSSREGGFLKLWAHSSRAGIRHLGHANQPDILQKGHQL